MFNENDNEICGLTFVESSAKTNELKVNDKLKQTLNVLSKTKPYNYQQLVNIMRKLLNESSHE